MSAWPLARLFAVEHFEDVAYVNGAERMIVTCAHLTLFVTMVLW